MSKPVLLLDMDGPIADFDLAYWNMCQSREVEMDISSMEDTEHRFMSEHVVDQDARNALRSIIDRTRWFLGLPVTAGALEGVPLLEDKFDVWVCTKPLEANHTCRDDKAAWLRLHFPHLEHKLILAPDKSRIHGDILLDDAIKPQWRSTATWKGVTFSTPFNGPGTPYSSDLHWTWGDDVDLLLQEVPTA